jgi:ElaB/YqjD/DUF883 family membrane-anchored ribosome-binding protein
VADEITPTRGTDDLESELSQSRERARRLMDNLARKIGASRRVRGAAHFVSADEWKDVAVGIKKVVRGRPATAMLVALVAGFLVGRALRNR